MNILIPMAGLGKRFKDAGYIDPKPFIDVNGLPMIKWASNCFNGDYIFICSKEHVAMMKKLYPTSTIIETSPTEGATCTSLLAKEYIDNNEELIIANCDQYVEYNGFLEYCENYDGCSLVFYANESKWSYVKVNNDLVEKVAEKEVISNLANCGIYYWRKGRDYVKYAEQSIKENIRTNGEFYIATVYNHLISAGGKVSYFLCNKMIGMGTPEDLVKAEPILRNF